MSTSASTAARGNTCKRAWGAALFPPGSHPRADTGRARVREGWASQRPAVRLVPRSLGTCSPCTLGRQSVSGTVHPPWSPRPGPARPCSPSGSSPGLVCPACLSRGSRPETASPWLSRWAPSRQHWTAPPPPPTAPHLSGLVPGSPRRSLGHLLAGRTASRACCELGRCPWQVHLAVPSPTPARWSRACTGLTLGSHPTLSRVGPAPGWPHTVERSTAPLPGPDPGSGLPAQSPTSCVPTGKLLLLSGPQAPHPQNGEHDASHPGGRWEHWVRHSW